MKAIKFKSIQARLTFWFLILSLGPLLIGILITFSQRSHTIEHRSYDKLTAIRDLKAQQLNYWLNSRMGDIEVMSGDYEIRGLENSINKVIKSDDDIETIAIARELFHRNLRNYKDYEEIFFIDAESGIIMLSTNKDFEGMNKALDPYFTNPLKTGKIHIKNIYYSETLKYPQMTISAPIFSMENNTHIHGVLVARIDLHQSLYKLLENRIGLGESGETLIVNDKVIALNELRHYENAPLNLKITAEPAVRASEGETGIIKTLDYRNTEILAAYTYIPQTGWGFICKQDMYELNAPKRTLLKNFIILYLISIVVVVFISLLIIKKISKPIIEMNTATQKIKKGDYTVRTTINSMDEMGSLANSINEMAASIETVNKVQKRVAGISNTMIGLSSMKKFGTGLLGELMQITKANMATFYVLNEASSQFEHFSSIGANEKLLKSFSSTYPKGEFGYAVSKKEIVYLQDIPDDSLFQFNTSAGDLIPKEIITIPILIKNEVAALISLVNIRKFSIESYEILKQSWLNINSSYSNLLANDRTRILAEGLAKSNQKLEAQSEELQEQAEELQGQAEELQEQTTEVQRSSEELQIQNLKLEAQKTQVEEANRLKSEFLSNMSHELRTPLNSINALSQVLISQSKNKLNEDENSYLEIIERNGKRLLALINSILDLSKIESGKIDIMSQTVSIKSLLTIISESIIPLTLKSGISFKLNVDENLPQIETDEARIHQVLLNIISNAVKFTNKGSVTVSAKQEKESIIIEVKDTGIGISEEMIPHIFDEFRQADGSSSRQYEGTGLGLAIAKKLIIVLGGTISVKSKLGEGTLFTVIIPVKWENEYNLKDTLILGDLEIAQQTQPSVKNTEKKSILLVEDNEDTVTQMKSILERENYIVDVATGGQAAIDYIKHTIPDGIILDLMMPGIDGFQVLENIRSSEAGKSIPVLILTAKDLTQKDLNKLSLSKIQQLYKKGDVDIETLIIRISLMMQGHKLDGSEAKESGYSTAKMHGNKSKENNLEMDSELINLLVVEDNPDNMATIHAILKGKYMITEAYDGEEGIKLALSQVPDMILLDISLPKENGEKVLQILKKNIATKNIPVIVITASVMKGDKERFLAAGCDAFVAKPIDPKNLNEEITKLLGN